jgi:glucan phosphoethanolaminetransferase (alkaline phosphatase superfamily)
MASAIPRRDFLKLAGLLPLSLAAPRWAHGLVGANAQPNVIFLLFDALSACDLSLYGYARNTMPNLARWAERAIVYHNHYAAGNFTSSGTASLLTGTHLDADWRLQGHRGLYPPSIFRPCDY